MFAKKKIMGGIEVKEMVDQNSDPDQFWWHFPTEKMRITHQNPHKAVPT